MEGLPRLRPRNAARGAPRAYLLDVEGTTTPIGFVHDVLFPYARAHMGPFLAAHRDSAEVARDIAALEDERAREEEQDAPALTGGARLEAGREPGPISLDAILGYARWLMERDRKSPALKSLQGKVWREGYARGALRGEVFDDVPPALRRWTARGARVAVFSSGSVVAQQLLFRHSKAGDLTGSFSRHFDLAMGGKKEASSYRRIAAELGLAPSDVVFVSDLASELDAAREAGMETRLSLRPGNAVETRRDHAAILSFDPLD